MSDDRLVGNRAGRRPWVAWLFWAVWLAGQIFLLQNALASAGELEPRASSIFWMLFTVGLAVGALVWVARRAGPAKA